MSSENFFDFDDCESLIVSVFTLCSTLSDFISSSTILEWMDSKFFEDYWSVSYFSEFILSFLLSCIDSSYSTGDLSKISSCFCICTSSSSWIYFLSEDWKLSEIESSGSRSPISSSLWSSKMPSCSSNSSLSFWSILSTLLWCLWTLLLDSILYKSLSKSSSSPSWSESYSNSSISHGGLFELVLIIINFLLLLVLTLKLCFIKEFSFLSSASPWTSFNFLNCISCSSGDKELKLFFYLRINESSCFLYWSEDKYSLVSTLLCSLICFIRISLGESNKSGLLLL